MIDLGDFVWSERNRYEGNDNNLFAFSFSQVMRYVDFVRLAHERHEKTASQVGSAFRAIDAITPKEDGSLSDEEEASLDLLHRSTFHLQYEEESFFLFCKILLDKVAQFIWDYFGHSRGISLLSHDRLVKSLRLFAARKGIVLPDGFEEAATRLKDGVAEYRDKQITHLHSPRALRAISFDDTAGRSAIITSRLFPTQSDPAEAVSPPVEEVAIEVSNYLALLIALIERNRSRSRYALKAGHGGESTA